jgi:putative transposase
VRFINQHRTRFGVEPICQALQVAPSTYYAAASRLPSARRLRDKELKAEIARVHRDNFDVYGVEKVWKQLKRERIDCGRDRVARLMGELELEGVVRGKVWRTTIPSEAGGRPADLVERNFTASAPNHLWVADLTYVSTWSGVAYVAFVTDVFSRYIVGWKVSTSLRAELALDALEMAIWARGSQDLSGLVHHSDRGSQYLSIRYTERLADEQAVVSVGSRGDSYDNALAESVIGLYKTEVVKKKGSWRSFEQLELATARWVDWYNNRRLHSAIGDVPPAEFEAAYLPTTRSSTRRDSKPASLQESTGDSSRSPGRSSVGVYESNARKHLGALRLDGLERLRVEPEQVEDGRCDLRGFDRLVTALPSGTSPPETTSATSRSCGLSPPCSAILPVPPV